MTRLIKSFVDICLFRGKPQDLPGNTSLVLITALIGVLTKTMLDGSKEPFSAIFPVAGTHVIVFGAVVWVTLRIGGFAERWNQTISALYGTDSLVRLIGWPILSWFYGVKESADVTIDAQSGLPPELMAPLMLLGVFAFWTIAIMTFVLRHALEKTVGVSLMITLACQLASTVIVYWLFPGEIIQNQ